MFDHEHDRFLRVKDGCMHFGCVNPFCGHGDPALPNHWELPMNIPTMTLKVVSHEARKLKVAITLKRDSGEFKAGQTVTVVADDNLESCKAEFDKVFGSSVQKKTAF